MTAKIHKLNLLRQRVLELPPEAVSEIEGLRRRIAELESQLDQEYSAWDHVQLSRHENRPYTLDYTSRVFEKFSEIHGDRKYADDPAIVGGMAILDGQPVMVVGQQKGRNTKDRIYRNYGMPKPEGYRKALRLMHFAEKFGRPIISFIDTPGAYPGIGAEERGQAEAIACNLRAMAQIQVPFIALVLGEGGSGGALAIGVADRVLMLEHSIYSVISPESCSAILWKSQDGVQEAARSLKLTAQDLLAMKVIDEVIEEPPGGAQNDFDLAARNIRASLLRHLGELRALAVERRIEDRYQKFRRMGSFQDS